MCLLVTKSAEVKSSPRGRTRPATTTGPAGEKSRVRHTGEGIILIFTLPGYISTDRVWPVSQNKTISCVLGLNDG